MKKIFFISLSVLLLAACGGDVKNLKKGLLLIQQKKYQPAITVLTSAINSNPNNAAAYAARALARESFAKQDKRNSANYIKLAEQDYRKALELAPNNPEVLNNFASFYIDNNRSAAALPLLDRALAARPAYSLAYTNRGVAYSKLGRNSEAMFDLDRAIDINPDNTLAYFNLGLVYSKLNYNVLAIDEFTKVIYKDPSSARTYLERGKALQKESFYTQALDDYNTAAYLDPQYSLAYYHMADLLFKKGEDAPALNSLMRSKELDNHYAPAYELMGDILAIDDPIAAAANYIVAKELDPAGQRRYNAKIKAMATEKGRQNVILETFDRQ